MRRAGPFAVLAALLLCARAGGEEPAAPDGAREGSKLAPPRVLQRVDAVYPAEAQREGRSGTVLLDLELDAEGTITSIAVKESAGHGFDEAAIEALRRFRFAPATLDGKPVPARVTYSYKFVLKTVESSRPPVELPDLRVRLRGGIYLRGTRTPLSDATVTVIPEAIWKASRLPGPARQEIRPEDRVQVETDSAGAFEVSGISPGRHHLVVTAPNARRFEIEETIGDRDILTVNYYLEPNDYTRYESTVRADPNREEISRISLKTEELMKIPGSFGDALRAVENLPGIARAPFNSGLIIVRGAKPTDSKVYLSGGEVPQLYHFGGLRSVVPTELVERVDYFPGNFSARWGRAIGGAIDLDLRSPRRDRVHGSIEVNFFDAGAVVEGPLGKGGFFLAARRSYVDAVLAIAAPSGLTFQSAPVYYDYQAGLEHPLGPGKIRLLISGADDQLKLVLDKPADTDPLVSGFGTHIAYHRLQLRWTGKLGGWSLFLQSSTGYTAQDGQVGRALSYDIWNVGTDLRVEGRRSLGPRFKLLLGLDTQYAYVNLANDAPAPPREGTIISPVSAQTRQHLEQRFHSGNIGAYAELQWKPTERFTITPGMRFDWYSALNLPTFDPRLTARFQLGKYSWLKTGIGLYSQAPAATDYNATYGNPDIRPEHAIHAAVGWEQGILPGLMLELSCFYKYLYDLAAPSDQFTVRRGPTVAERVASIGEGQIFGGELLLRQSISKYFFGWVSYTLMRSIRKDCPDCAYRTFDYDQTHVLILALHGYLPKGFEIGLRFRYITGYPANRPYGGYYDADADVYSAAQGPVNTDRLADYHSLDLRVDKTFLFKKWVLKIYLDIYNVYNRRNEEVAQLSFDFTRSTPIHGLPIIPSFGIRGEF
jgi:TonB family protein